MKQSILSKDGVSYVVPFILITSCFALWGFANDITNPMVKAFSKIFRMSATDGALVQVAFYGGYFAMAFPAAMFIRRYSYKAGVLVGLGLYALGAFMFYPAKMTGEYYPFLIAYFILTCGLSFLETSSNPYILSMGTEETATRRLNLAQSFNPMGSLLGMYVAMNFIQAKLNPLDTASRADLTPAEFEAVKEYDLSVLIGPYLAIRLVILADGMAEQAAEVTSQQYNILAMIIFCCSRFICTFLLRYVNTGRLLTVLAIVGGLLVVGVIGLQNIYGLYCLVGVSACMSLMFPTIYGIALTGLGDDAKFGAAGLIMAILGGSVLPPFQAAIIDQGELLGMPAVNVSFILPFVCFVVIAIYGHRTFLRSKGQLGG